MLKEASFQSFTTVPNSRWEFSAGLNIVVGENGMGKSHVLKAIYALLRAQSEKRDVNELDKHFAAKLLAVLRPESLGRLVKRKQGRDRCEIELKMENANHGCKIGFATNAKSSVEVVKSPTTPLNSSPVYFPTRELITLSPWFLPLYDNFQLEFEETWRDTVSLLGAPAIKGPREKTAGLLLRPLEKALNGKVHMDKNGRFYLNIAGEGKMEMPLVAEGMRKFAMLARLISTGVLLDKGYLFWDEPETNLNPRLIKILAKCIHSLANSGIQVFLATHSLFLLRELEIIASEKAGAHKAIRWFAIADVDGTMTLEQGDAVADLKTLVLLDEELAQSDRFLEAAP